MTRSRRIVAENQEKKRIVALLSGGLDSQLAVRMMQIGRASCRERV